MLRPLKDPTNGSLVKLQQDLMAYLLDQQNSITGQILDEGCPVQVRLNIYKNAYRMRLKQALEQDHPMLGLYLGNALFEQMLDTYVDSFPSAYTSLRQFGEQLPVMLADTAPFAQIPIIAEIARFERALLTAFDARDEVRVTQQHLQTIEPEAWSEMVFTLHPSVQILSTEWNAIETWQALKQGEKPPTATQQLSHWLIWRNPEPRTEFRPLSHIETLCFSLILQGVSFGNLCEALSEQISNQDPDKDIARYIEQALTDWLDCGLLCKPA